jgi:LmbE family N-acetylglucosaminyl deacetylase
MLNPSRILILAPHTDDGELGCGGSIARFCSDGKNVFYAAFSICSASLPEGLADDTLAQECKKATAHLGIKPENLFLFDFEVRNFPSQRQAILEQMIQLNHDIQPELVFIPSATDTHQDHGVIHAEGLRAFKNASVLGYEQPWNQSRFQTAFFINLSADDIRKKTEALNMYRSQSHRNYMQEDFIVSLAKVRGVQAHSEYAEAFEVYRVFA